MVRLHATALTSTALLCVAASGASAAERLTIRGAGYGHGVGMSQYGAYGMAKEGHTHAEILAHYYTGTRLTTAPSRKVRVLLQQTARPRFTGARKAAGRKLRPTSVYGVRPGPGGTVELLSPTGRRLKRTSAPLRVRGGPIKLLGRAMNGRSDGRYRGSMEFRPSGSTVLAVNAVGLERYLRGVVPDEMPPSWHPEALKAQAVAARTYAVTTSKAGNGWDQYPDTRSQVYGGRDAEVRSATAAIRATKGQLVTHGGEPVTTFFFSTSGGRTEDVENTTLGVEPKPWLKSVADPHDKISPLHRWTPRRMSHRKAASKLGGLVKGSFKGIKVVERGSSPRIVAAYVIGSAGRTRVDGATLRWRLGLPDTWAYFTSIETDDEPAPDSSGGASPAAVRADRTERRLVGSVVPARRGAEAVVQIRRGKRGARRWKRVGVVELGARGRYAFDVPQPGVYRVKYRRVPGPRVAVR